MCSSSWLIWPAALKSGFSLHSLPDCCSLHCGNIWLLSWNFWKIELLLIYFLWAPASLLFFFNCNSLFTAFVFSLAWATLPCLLLKKKNLNYLILSASALWVWFMYFASLTTNNQKYFKMTPGILIMTMKFLILFKLTQCETWACLDNTDSWQELKTVFSVFSSSAWKARLVLLCVFKHKEISLPACVEAEGVLLGEGWAYFAPWHC